MPVTCRFAGGSLPGGAPSTGRLLLTPGTGGCAWLRSPAELPALDAAGSAAVLPICSAAGCPWNCALGGLSDEAPHRWWARDLTAGKSSQAHTAVTRLLSAAGWGQAAEVVFKGVKG